MYWTFRSNYGPLGHKSWTHRSMIMDHSVHLKSYGGPTRHWTFRSNSPSIQRWTYRSIMDLNWTEWSDLWSITQLYGDHSFAVIIHITALLWWWTFRSIIRAMVDQQIDHGPKGPWYGPFHGPSLSYSRSQLCCDHTSYGGPTCWSIMDHSVHDMDHFMVHQHITAWLWL